MADMAAGVQRTKIRVSSAYWRMGKDRQGGWGGKYQWREDDIGVDDEEHQQL